MTSTIPLFPHMNQNSPHIKYEYQKVPSEVVLRNNLKNHQIYYVAFNYQYDAT